ncbi:AfsR/SARP family transcriptional regulator, partial [Streptomyces sp. URMC 126]|uniref:AfsR/SARP family transcriptional regulator n=1 Tax=Streptomyces sp. URMC 126 TaxID=3423401 RepID=UPI003F1C34E2
LPTSPLHPSAPQPEELLVRIALLGPVEVCADDGSPIELGGARLRMVLARLALAAGRPVSTGTLVEDLWGERLPAGAGSALQASVSRLRKALRGAGTIELTPAGYRLPVHPEDVDVHRFEELTARGRRELAAGRDAEGASLLAAALRIWRGTALADVRNAPFAERAATRLHEARAAAAEGRFAAELRRGRHAEVLAELGVAGAEHPLNERLAELRMRALAAAGQLPEALEVYARVRRGLREELGVDPSVRLRDLQLALLRGEGGDGEGYERSDDRGAEKGGGRGGAASASPAGRRPVTRRVVRPAGQMSDQAPDHASDEVPEEAPDRRAVQRRVAAPGRLPAHLTSFVGREQELRVLADTLAASRLVTIVGPGGSGKTRLSLEAVSRAPAGAHGRVWFVPLAGVGAPEGPADAVLAALGAADTGGGPAAQADRIAELLAGDEAVLVLDNCEHLVDAAAEFADRLLGRARRLRLLVTSREPLAVTGERLLRLGPLPVPAAHPTPAEAVGAASVRLFVDRATAVRPDFVLDGSTVGPVAAICRRLDGMPLAVELAAGRLRAMAVGQIADRLGDRFRLLTSGSRTAPPRQRTLRALVEWSWDLLDDAERALAGRLSVFPGGAGLATLEAVCADASLPAGDILYVLTSLVEKSLVIADPGVEPRYRMAETERAYAASRHAVSGPDLTARFVDHFLALAETTAPLLRTARCGQAAAVLHAEHDNVVHALRTAVRTGDTARAARLFTALLPYWAMRGTAGRTEPSNHGDPSDTAPTPANWSQARAFPAEPLGVEPLGVGTPAGRTTRAGCARLPARSRSRRRVH